MATAAMARMDRYRAVESTDHNCARQSKQAASPLMRVCPMYVGQKQAGRRPSISLLYAHPPCPSESECVRWLGAARLPHVSPGGSARSLSHAGPPRDEAYMWHSDRFAHVWPPVCTFPRPYAAGVSTLR